MQKKLIRAGIVIRGDDSLKAVRSLVSERSVDEYAQYQIHVRAEAELAFSITGDHWTRLCVYTLGAAIPGEEAGKKRHQRALCVTARSDGELLREFLQHIGFSEQAIDNAWIDPQVEDKHDG